LGLFKRQKYRKMSSKSLYIQQELQEVAPSLVAIGTTDVYEVPSGYFAALPNKITLAAAKSTTLQNLPNNYFATLPEKIFAKIHANQTSLHELETIAPLLIGLKNQNTYTVPTGYFSNKRFTQPKAKVLTIKHSWFKYAAAAACVGIMCFIALQFNTAKTRLDATTKQGILLAKNINIENAIDGINNTDIESYLQNTIEATDEFTEAETTSQTTTTNNQTDVDAYLDLIDELPNNQ
jgi:hypothetical protein